MAILILFFAPRRSRRIYGPIVFKNLHNSSLTCLCTHAGVSILPANPRAPFEPRYAVCVRHACLRLTRTHARLLLQRTKYNVKRPATESLRGNSPRGRARRIKNPIIVLRRRKYAICPRKREYRTARYWLISSRIFHAFFKRYLFRCCIVKMSRQRQASAA